MPAVPTETREVAFISGGTSAVGVETALLLGARGASVVIFDRLTDAVSETVNRLEARGVEAIGLTGDDETATDVAEAVDNAVVRLGRITTVVTSTCVLTPGEPHLLKETEWRRCINANLTSVYLVARSTLLHLTQGGGAFVSLTTTGSVSGLKGLSAVSASMHGVVGLIKSMSLDYARQGVRFNAVSCGLLDDATSIINDDHPSLAAFKASQIKRTPMERVGKPVEIARLIAHLTSPAATFTSGAVHTIDGGLSAGYLNRKEA